MVRAKYEVASEEEGSRPARRIGPCSCSPRVCAFLVLLVLLVLAAAIIAAIFIHRALQRNKLNIADGRKLFRGGEKISEGDMLLEDPSDRRLLNAARNRDRLWPEGRVPYRIDEDIGCPDTPRCVVLLAAMDEYRSRTCVLWEAATRQDQPALMLRYRPSDGCFSHVGYRGNERDNNEHLIVLGDGCFNKGIILHLLGHTLGLWHEHNRPDRDSWIKINRTNVATDHQNSFHKFTQSQHHIVDRLDLKSIMMHGSRAYSEGGRDVTMTSHWSPGPLAEVWQKAQLSVQDVDRVQSMYIRQCSMRRKDLGAT